MVKKEKVSASKAEANLMSGAITLEVKDVVVKEGRPGGNPDVSVGTITVRGEGALGELSGVLQDVVQLGLKSLLERMKALKWGT